MKSHVNNQEYKTAWNNNDDNNNTKVIINQL